MLDEEKISILEGLLYIVGDDGINKSKLLEVLEVDGAELDEMILNLQTFYSDDKRGIELVEFNDNYKFLSKAIVYPYAQKLFVLNKNKGLSNAALETLAIIAYKGPITRIEIEEIRGVGSDNMLRKLLLKELIKENGRSDSAGKPILYEVTDKFLDMFSLKSLKELPELMEFNNEEDISI